MRTISQLLPLAMSVELNPSIRCSVVLSKYVVVDPGCTFIFKLISAQFDHDLVWFISNIEATLRKGVPQTVDHAALSRAVKEEPIIFSLG